eukprot:scaffold7326_cov249-Pinguiococcus_pyrenoidosus.AAC.3
MASGMRRRGERGGALVAASTSLLRGASDVEQLVADVLQETRHGPADEQLAQLEDAFVLALQTRDCRGGKGERDIFYRMLLALKAEGFGDVVLAVLPLIPKMYGSWKDLCNLYGLAGGFDKNNRRVKAPRPARGRRRAKVVAPRSVRKAPVRITGPQHAEIMDACLALLAGQLRKDYEKLRAALAAEEEAAAGPESGEAMDEAGAADEEPKAAEEPKDAEEPRDAEEPKDEKKPVVISLAAKWAPREKRSHDAYSRIAREVALKLFPVGGEGYWASADKAAAKRKYRKLVARLNAHLETVEVHMSAHEWDEVDPARVPSRAMTVYRKALRNLDAKGNARSEDPARIRLAERVEQLAAATRADPSAAGGLKGKQLFPYEIVRHFMGRGKVNDPILEAQWAVQEHAVRDLAQGGAMPNGVCLCDVSGSMSGIPMENSIALGILLSQNLPEPWKGRILTFESTPRWHQLPTHEGVTLEARVKSLSKAPWGGSTNFGLALDVILETATDHGVSQEDMPEVLYVFTDMQFDTANMDGSNRTGFDTAAKRVAKKYRKAGYEVPHILFWNLRANTCAFAAEADSKGVSLLSGFSPALFKAFMGGREELEKFRTATPYETLRTLLDDERYEPVRRVVRRVRNPGKDAAQDEEGKAEETTVAAANGTEEMALEAEKDTRTAGKAADEKEWDAADHGWEVEEDWS